MLVRLTDVCQYRSERSATQSTRRSTAGSARSARREGIHVAIAPTTSMVNIGTANAGQPGVKMLNDGWTVVTQDGSLSAHFEHTVLITAGEPEILTCHAPMPSVSKAL